MQEEGQKTEQGPSHDAIDAAASSASPEVPSEHARESSASSGDASPANDGGVDLKAALAAAQDEARQHYDAFLRARAETENVRRRAEDDVSKARKFGSESFAESLLAVMDSLEAALADQAADVATMRTGVEATQRQLASAFERNRLTAIDPVGQKFDPHRHQAISMQESTDVEPNHVISVLQKGWMISDRVLRPALVTVAKGG